MAKPLFFNLAKFYSHDSCFYSYDRNFIKHFLYATVIDINHTDMTVKNDRNRLYLFAFYGHTSNFSCYNRSVNTNTVNNYGHMPHSSIYDRSLKIQYIFLTVKSFSYVKMTVIDMAPCHNPFFEPA